MKTDEIRLVLSKRQLKAVIAAAALSVSAYLVSETVTLSTTYPAPSGVYSQMVTTGNTYLARDPGAKVGLGTTSPAALLDVNGAAKVARFYLNGYEIPSPPAGTTALNWQTTTVGYQAASASYGGWSGCSYWYTSESCGDPNGAYTCQPTDDKTCLDLLDAGCSWGVRLGRTVTCKPEKPGVTAYVLSAQ